MAFRDQYTTASLVTLDITSGKLESKKVVLSNDALAIGELLESLINKMVK